MTANYDQDNGPGTELAAGRRLPFNEEA